jgi:deoxyribodipyrimidine photolyase
MSFADGRTVKEKLPMTAKTIAGRYIVSSIPSEIYGRQMDIIVSYNEKEKTIKVWTFYGDVVVEGTNIYDVAKRIYSGYSQFSSEDGQFTEITVGSHTDSEVSDHTVVLKDGKLFMTRDTKATPRK